MRVLLIDDEPFYNKLLSRPMKQAGHEFVYCKSGQDGLAAISSKEPEVIIIDLRLPDMDGFDILSRLRHGTQYSHVPVIVITAKNELGEKLKAFELGADDYLVKPFQPEELVARMRILARRGRAMKLVKDLEDEDEELATVVAVHSLRGGVGCSTVAVNLGLAFYQLWEKSSILVDSVMSAGQVAMMINAKPRFTLADFADIKPDAMDGEVLNDLFNSHDSGISYIAAPKTPIGIDVFTDDFWRTVFEKVQKNFRFVVIDTAHDFTDLTIQMLNFATTIVLVVSHDMSSLNAALNALDIYDKLGFSPDAIKIILNNNSAIAGIKQEQIEKALRRKVDYVLPYEPEQVVRAINFGKPLVLNDPQTHVSVTLQNMAYELTDDLFKNLPPAAPSETWKRVTERLGIKN